MLYNDNSMKQYCIILLHLVISFSVYAQSTNFALNNQQGAGKIEISTISELNHLSDFSLQWWMKASRLNQTAKLMGQDNFSVWLNSDNSISLQSGEAIARIGYTLTANAWVQVSLTVSSGTVKAYINNVQRSVTGSLPHQLPVASSVFTLSEGFSGMLDEIRIWKKDLAQKDLCWRNTLNRFHPNHESLIAYWKGDQDQCEHLVDYRLKYHGKMTGIDRVAVADNSNFRYRVVSGYTSLMRFIDRPNINRDMFLMTNDVILLSAKVMSDGSIFPEYPDNSASLQQVSYLDEFEGRRGLMHFNGVGSKMVAQDGRTLFDPTTQGGYGSPLTASIQGWIYIDEWNEGSKLFSKYKSADSCLVISLGSENDRSLIVNFNGTIATLSQKVSIGKWHYLGVYLRPKVAEISNPRAAFNLITIGVDFKEYNALSEIKLSGNNMSVTRVPLMTGVPVVIGEDFKGKIDELMLWGNLRNESARYDAENGYQWNIGSWNNVYLCSYWKGDDAENVGKDYQSYTGMIDFIRGYFANHRGHKIRLSLIYSNGDGWKSVLSKPQNLDRMLADCRKLLDHCDGLDVDLEWSYNTYDYSILNNVLRRLYNEVMKDRPEKVYSVSLHQVSYGIDKALIPTVDYFTFQLYGPHKVTYQYDWYQNAYNSFINYGFPRDKMLLSYGVLLVNDLEEKGYKDLFEQMGMNESNYKPELNSWNGWAFNGVNQIKRKQELIVGNDVLGTMYFDMGNDLKVSDARSLIRAQNDIIAANVDTVITQVNIYPTSVHTPILAKGEVGKVVVNYQQQRLDIQLCEGVSSVKFQLFSPTGTLVDSFLLSEKSSSYSLNKLNRGVWLVRLSSDNATTTTKIQL